MGNIKEKNLYYTLPALLIFIISLVLVEFKIHLMGDYALLILTDIIFNINLNPYRSPIAYSTLASLANLIFFGIPIFTSFKFGQKKPGKTLGIFLLLALLLFTIFTAIAISTCRDIGCMAAVFIPFTNFMGLFIIFFVYMIIVYTVLGH